MSNETKSRENDSTVCSSAAATTPSQSSTSPGKKHATVPEVLKHQKSFELRYSHIIHKQILENNINMDALQRQLNAFLPLSRSSSLTIEGSPGNNSQSGGGIVKGKSNDDIQLDLKEVDDELEVNVKPKVIVKLDTVEDDLTEEEKHLEKLETLDIADKSESDIC